MIFVIQVLNAFTSHSLIKFKFERVKFYLPYPVDGIRRRRERERASEVIEQKNKRKEWWKSNVRKQLVDRLKASLYVADFHIYICLYSHAKRITGCLNIYSIPIWCIWCVCVCMFEGGVHYTYIKALKHTPNICARARAPAHSHFYWAVNDSNTKWNLILLV